VQTRVDHETGGYAYLPGGGFASRGVIALDGMAVEHVVFARSVPFDSGLVALRRHLDRAQRPLDALCGLELRLPRTMSMLDFEDFNKRYLDALGALGLLRAGEPPLTRTNVVPSAEPPAVPSLLGFSYTRPGGAGRVDMVITGVADLGPQGVIRPGKWDRDAMVAKASFVAHEVDARVTALGSVWDAAARTHLYCRRPAVFAIARKALGPLTYGLVWHDCAPPVSGLELEIDVRRHHYETNLEEC
jgi:hypothetical protein